MFPRLGREEIRAPLKTPAWESKEFHDVVRFERFTNLNLIKYAFNVIQNWKTDALRILFNSTYFLLAVMVEGDESSRLFWPVTGPY